MSGLEQKLDIFERYQRHYTALPKDILERTRLLQEKTVPATFKPKAFSLGHLLEMGQHLSPSKALPIYFEQIEQALLCWQQLNQLQSPLAQDLQLKAELAQALAESFGYLREQFAGELYAEIDGYWASCEASPATDTVLETANALQQWYAELIHIAGDDLALVKEENAFLSVTNQVQRIEAANHRISSASQYKWLANNAQYAFNELSTALSKLQSVSAIYHDEYSKYRVWYNRFQPFITRGDICSRQQAEQLDLDICTTFKGLSAMGKPLPPSAELAQQNRQGFGALQVFNPKDALYQQLEQQIQAKLAEYRALESDERSSDKNKNAFAHSYVLDVCSKLELSFDDSRFQCSIYPSLAASGAIDAKAGVGALFAHLKALEKQSRDFKFLIKISEQLAERLGEYNGKRSSDIKPQDRKLLSNYLNVLRLFIGDVAQPEFKDIQAFINNENPSKLMLGSVYRRQVLQIQQQLYSAIDERVQLISDCKSALRVAFDEYIETQPLLAGNTKPHLLVGQSSPVLLREVALIEKEIEQTFSALSDSLKSGIAKASNRFYQSKNFYREWQAEQYCSSEVFNYLWAKRTFDLLSKAAKKLMHSGYESDPELYKRLLSEVYQELNKRLTIYDDLMMDGDERLAMLASQVQSYVNLLSTHFPFEVKDERSQQYLLDKPAINIHFAGSENYPYHWLQKLACSSLFDQGASFSELLEQFQWQLRKPKPTLEDIQTIEKLMPQLIALVSIFEVENNLQPGAVNNDLSLYLEQQYQSLIARANMPAQQQYDLNKSNQRIAQGLDLYYQAALSKLEEQDEILNQHIAKLEALQKSATAYGAFNSKMANLQYAASYLPVIGSKLSLDPVQMKAAKDQFAQCYSDACFLLGAESKLLDDQYLRTKTDYFADLPTISKACDSQLAKLKTQKAQCRQEIARKKTFTDYYQLKMQENQQQKKQNGKQLLNHMADQIIDSLGLRLSKVKEILLFEGTLFYQRAMQELHKKKEVLINVAMGKTTELSESMELITRTNSQLDERTGQQQFESLSQELEVTYKQQLALRKYHQRLAEIEILVQEFQQYLNQPEWFAESDSTIARKKLVLDNILKIIKDDKKSVLSRFADARKIITAPEAIGKPSFEQILKADINPHYTDVTMFVSYWFMKLVRAVGIVWTGALSQRDILTNRLLQTVDRADGLSGQRGAAENDQALLAGLELHETDGLPSLEVIQNGWEQKPVTLYGTARKVMNGLLFSESAASANEQPPVEVPLAPKPAEEAAQPVIPGI